MAKIKPKHTFEIRWTRSPEKWTSKNKKKRSNTPEFSDITRTEVYRQTKEWLENNEGGRIAVFYENGLYHFDQVIPPANEPPNLFNLYS